MQKKLPADFPKNRADWERVLAAAPGADRAPTAKELAQWDRAVVVHSGGPKAIREALAARRTRGPGKKPAKTLLTLRIAPAVIERWKATGPGWQTRMVERLSVAPRR